MGEESGDFGNTEVSMSLVSALVFATCSVAWSVCVRKILIWI